MVDFSLVTLDEIREYIGINDGDPSYNMQLIPILYSVTRMLESYTRRPIEKVAFTEIFNTRTVIVNQSIGNFRTRSVTGSFFINNDAQNFYLKLRPVDKPAGFTVHYDPSREFAASTLVEEITNGVPNWEVDTEKAILYLYTATSREARSLKVSYTGGVDVTIGSGFNEASATVDVQLKQAALMQSAHIFQKFRELNLNNTSEQERTGEGRDFAKVGGLIPEAMALANNHKLNLTGSRP